MAKYSAAQFDERIAGYEADRNAFLEKIERVEKQIALMPDDEYRRSNVAYRARLLESVTMCDGLIADYTRWKDER